MASAAITYASNEQSVPSEVLAWITVGFATLMLVAVAGRMTWHQICVWRGLEVWSDPLLESLDKTGSDSQAGDEDVESQAEGEAPAAQSAQQRTTSVDASRI